MGVPVFHGGFSTFLAVMTLATAVSYSMRLFFNKFASVCIFGLWHALFVLPCVLSFIGADPFDAHKTTAAGAGSKPGVVQVDPEPSKIQPRSITTATCRCKCSRTTRYVPVHTFITQQ